MGDQAINAVVAIALGTVAAIVLLVPTAAYQYRLDGRLEPRDLAVLLSGAVYGLALWTYTLLPMPEPDTYRCKGRQLDPFGSIREIFVDSPERLAQFSQVGLNVLLFVPLGFYLRVILKRGVVTATLAGLGTSLLIETTQTTGIWHLYDCAYRLFDVDDLIVNTLGAIGGSLLSYVVLDRRDDTTPPLPTTVSLGRRLMSLAADVLSSALVGGAVAALYRGITVYGPDAFSYDRDVMVAVALAVPYAVQAASVMAVGRTLGEHVVACRAVERVPSRRHVARAVKLLVGVTPAFALAALGGWAGLVGLVALAVLHAATSVRTEQHRGLTHVVAGMDLRIATEEALDVDRSAGRR